MSAEHVWPAWAARLLAEDGPSLHVITGEKEGHADFKRSWERDPFTETAKAVCRSCNNEWMSDLEVRAKPYLEPMLHRHGRVIRSAGQRTLSTWALKTAMILAFMQGAGRGVVSPSEHTYLREHEEPSENVRVWIAAYTGEHHATANIYGFDATDGEALGDPDRGVRNIWTVTHSFGPIVFQVFGTNIKSLARDLEISRPPYVHEIWPRAKSFTWTPTPRLGTEQLMAFGNQLGEELHNLVSKSS